MTTYKMSEIAIQRLEQELRNEYNKIQDAQQIMVEESILARKLKDEALYLPEETRHELDALSKSSGNYNSIYLGEEVQAALASIFADDLN